MAHSFEGYLYYYIDAECEYYFLLPCRPRAETIRRILAEKLRRKDKMLRTYAKLRGLDPGNVSAIIDVIVESIERGSIHFLYDDVFSEALEKDCGISLEPWKTLEDELRSFSGKRVRITIGVLGEEGVGNG